MKHVGRLLLACTLVGGVASGWACAQDEDDGSTKKEETAQTKEGKLRDAYRQFEEKLNESANAFANESPEKAQRIRNAVKASREAFEKEDGKYEAIAEHMDKIVELLGREKGAQGALVVEKEVMDALERVLEVLESDDPMKSADRLSVPRLEQLRRELDRIIKEQRAHKDELAKVRDLETKARAIAEASKKLGEALDKQKKLAEKTGDMKPEEAEALAKEQKELAKEAADLQELMKLADQVKGPGEEGKPEDAQPSPATKSVESAKGAMDQAGKHLDDEKKPEALERQRKAIEDLEEAKKSLEKKAAVIERLAQIEKKKAKLEEIRQATEDLKKKFEEQPPSAGDPQQGGGKQGGGKQGGQAKKNKGQGEVPGRRKIEQAEDEQKRAGDDLENRHMKDAEDKEEEAAKKLEEAKEALREALIQARKREQEETLKALGQHFLGMLAIQKTLTKRTFELDATRRYDAKGVASDLNRKQKIECSRIARGAAPDKKDEKKSELGEADLRDEAETTIELTTEEGSSTILPTVLGELKEDLARVTELLDKHDTGRFVQSVQHDIERTLEELIEVIKHEIEERKNGGGGGGGGGGDDDKNGEPLVPASAELKMIRAQQMRVNQKTKEFDLNRGTPDAQLTNDQREAVRLIAEKQGRVAEFTRRLHSKLNKEE